MSKLLKYIAYIALFVFSFLLFLYWTFPYNILKDRIISGIEGSLGGNMMVSVKELSPYWFTGVSISGLKVKSAGGGPGAELVTFDEMQVRVSVLSALFGSPRVKFNLDTGKGEISGVVRRGEGEMDVDVDIDNLDFKSFKIITAKTGLKLSSKIDGDIKLKVDTQRPIRSIGSISLDLGDLKIGAADIKLGEMELPLPELILSKRRGSEIKLEVGKGTLQFKSFKLTGGDLELDLSGKVFLSNNVENYRFNLTGSFKASAKLSEALPFLFIVEKQKREDGSYPISITGRLIRPSIKIGTFNLPI